MPKNKPTIYDVAKAAGVSITTVSRVLNSPERVNEATRTSVLSAIDGLGFIPQAEARVRAMKTTGRIGVIVPYFTAPSFVQRLRGVAAGLAKTNYELVIYTVDTADRLENYLSTLPISGYLDGLIVMSLRLSDANVARLNEYGVETVLIEYPQHAANTVEIDDMAGGRMVARYLMEKGHRRMAFLGDIDLPATPFIHPISQRLSGFRQTLNESGLDLPDSRVWLAPYSLDQTREVTLTLLNMPERPTAVFAATDLQAMGVMKACRELGLRVPQDLAVIGFDDLDVAEFIGLTTVRQHLDESGRIATELLISRLQDPHRSLRHVELPLTLIERETA